MTWFVRSAVVQRGAAGWRSRRHRAGRAALAAAVLLAVEASAAAASAPGRVAPEPAVAATDTRAEVRYAAPLGPPLQVVRRFEPPPTPFAAGHRGVDLA